MHLRAKATYIDRTYAEAEMTFSKMATSVSSTQVRGDTGNQRPEFDEGSATERFVLENTGAEMNIGSVVMADDSDTGDAVTYSLGGTDMASFDIMGDTGQLMTKAKLNYEMKNSYRVIVTATDSSGEANDSATIDVTIRVIDVDEAPMIMKAEPGQGLTISGRSSRSYTENGRGSVATYTATGAVGSVTWTLGGDDMDDFNISSSGRLTFMDPPDYEMPTDMGTNNVYMVTVMAGDGTSTDTHDVMVTVTDVDDSTVTPMPDDTLPTEFVKFDDGDGMLEVGEVVDAVFEHVIDGDHTEAEIVNLVIYFVSQPGN